MKPAAHLLIADSERDADMLYASGIFVPDPFIVIGVRNRWHGLLSPLEVDRARRSSRLDEVHVDSPWREKAVSLGWKGNLAGAAAAFLCDRGINRLRVPGSFPCLYADQLKSWGFQVEPSQGSLFPQRTIKSDAEITYIKRALNITKAAMRAAANMLAESAIGNDDILRHPGDGRRMKSKHLRSVIETDIIQNGALPSHTIVACGREGADPHHTGNGYLRAHQPIIIDIFPRVTATGYWGDMTRTYVKGKAGAYVRRLYRTVREGQDIGTGMVAAGVNGATIHAAILQHFDRCGFPTRVQRNRQTGFFHGTGHGLGLDVHEPPRISIHREILKTGQVVTVEPGLYYPEIGGVRLEDVVVVREGGCENLTRFPRRLEIA